MYQLSTNSIRVWILAAALAGLSGCATRQGEKVLPHGQSTMLDIWNQNTAGSGARGTTRELLDARQVLRRPLTTADVGATANSNIPYTRTAQTEVKQLFSRLPDPDLVMYVFPHLAGSQPTPVPGYSTVFPFYREVQYAMPGERTEDY